MSPLPQHQSSNAPSSPPPRDKPKRKRVRTACIQCRRRRTKCDDHIVRPTGEPPRSCTACDLADIACTWPSEPAASRKRRRRASPSPASSPASAPRDSPPHSARDRTQSPLGVDATAGGESLGAPDTCDGGTRPGAASGSHHADADHVLSQLPASAARTSVPLLVPDTELGMAWDEQNFEPFSLGTVARSPATPAMTSIQQDPGSSSRAGGKERGPERMCIGADTLDSRGTPLRDQRRLLQESLGETGEPEPLGVLVDTFFREVYPCPGLFFVRRDVIRDLDLGAAPVGLLLSMCALVMARSGKDTVAREWIRRAKAITVQIVDDGYFTADSLATLLLCFHYELRGGLFAAAWMTSGMASRLATALDLTCSSGSRSWPEQEYRRRLAWAMCLVDQYVSEGGSRQHNCLQIPLPCDEEALQSGEGYDSGRLSIPGSSSAVEWAVPELHARTAACASSQYIVISSIRATILGLNAADGSRPWEAASPAQQCRRALEWWRKNLGPSLDFEGALNQLSSDSACFSDLSVILALHTWYCIASCDLNSYAFACTTRPSTSILEAAPDGWITQAQDEYLSHALKILKLCRTVLTKWPTFVCQDPMLAPCFYRAAQACLWDLFRHPAPSPSMKRFVVRTCEPAIILCQRMSVFPFAHAVLRDFHGLFQQCELVDILCSELPHDVSNALRLSSSDPMPNAVCVDGTFFPSHTSASQSHLHPPFVSISDLPIVKSSRSTSNPVTHHSSSRWDRVLHPPPGPPTVSAVATSSRASTSASPRDAPFFGVSATSPWGLPLQGHSPSNAVPSGAQVSTGSAPRAVAMPAIQAAETLWSMHA